MAEDGSVSSNTLPTVPSTNSMISQGNDEGSHETPKMASISASNVSSALPTREQITIMKLREANNKYKSLLKMAKERIQAQEKDIESMQSESLSKTFQSALRDVLLLM